MKVFFDHQIFLSQKYGGISRYFVELAKNFPVKDCSVDILSPIYVNEYLSQLKRENVNIHGIHLDSIPRGKKFVSQFCMFYNSFYLKRNSFDIFHETYYSNTRITKRDRPTFITVYDMIYELFPDSFPVFDKTVMIKKNAINRADRIIAISQSTKNDLINILNIDERKIDVVHLSFSPGLTGSNVFEKQEDPFVLYVGSRGGYKNFKRLLEVFHLSTMLKKKFKLVCFGGGGFSREEQLMIQSFGLDKSVKLIQGGDDILAGLYKNAQCFVYPSLYEGFGLPPLEAMAQDCPCVVSNTSSIPEVCEEAAMYFDPYSVDDMKDKIEAICLDEDLRKKLIVKGKTQVAKFSWERCASETLESYRKLL